MKITLPNQLTLLRIILTPVFVIMFINPQPGYTLPASIVFLAAALTDWYDGYFARRLNLTSRWGQFMDPLADKVLISAALFVFAYRDYVYWWMIIIIIVRDFLITFLRSFALYIGKPIITSALAKWKTFLQMTFIFVLLIYINIPVLPAISLQESEQPWLLWTTIFLAIVTITTIYSGAHYLIVNRIHAIELFRRLAGYFTR
jgi:CDP-diacylglycerol--glycerol-3-phosphate 3-phosphatidyltransferase